MIKLSLGISKLQKLHNEYCQPKHVISFGGFNTPKNNGWLEQSAFAPEVITFEVSDERNKIYKLCRRAKIKCRFRGYIKISDIMMELTNLFNINIYCLR